MNIKLQIFQFFKTPVRDKTIADTL